MDHFGYTTKPLVEYQGFKNKRVQVSEENSSGKGESEAEIAPVSIPSSSQSTISHPDVEYKPPPKLEKPKSKRSSSKRSSTKAKASPTKPNTSAFGQVTEDVGGKHPRYFHSTRQETSDSETSLKDKEDDKESPSDYFTDS